MDPQARMAAEQQAFQARMAAAQVAQTAGPSSYAATQAKLRADHLTRQASVGGLKR